MIYLFHSLFCHAAPVWILPPVPLVPTHQWVVLDYMPLAFASLSWQGWLLGGAVWLQWGGPMAGRQGVSCTRHGVAYLPSVSSSIQPLHSTLPSAAILAAVGGGHEGALPVTHCTCLPSGGQKGLILYWEMTPLLFFPTFFSLCQYANLSTPYYDYNSSILP